MWNGIVIGALVAGIGCLAYSMLRSPPPLTSGIGRRMMSFQMASDTEAVFSAILASFPRGRYKVASHDMARGRIFLEAPISWASWGFYFPIDISERGGGTLIEIGIVSKAFQWGPLVTRAHKELFETVRSAVESKRLAAPGV